MNFKKVFELHKFLVEEGYLLVDETSNRSLQMQPVLDSGVSFQNTPPIIKEEILETLDEYDKWRDSTFDKKYKVLDNTTILKNLTNDSNFKMSKFVHWFKHNKALDSYFNVELKDQYDFKNEDFNKVMKYVYKNQTMNDKETFLYETILKGETKLKTESLP